MKKTVRILLLLLAFSCVLTFAVSCQDKGTAFDYTLTVTDGGGAYVKGIVVKLYDEGGAQVGANVTNARGEVTFKDITAGNYTAKIANGATKYNFKETEYKVTADKAGSSISFYETAGEELIEVFGTVPEKTMAHYVAPGYYSIELKAGEKTYFVLNLPENGVYGVDYEAQKEAYIGYYGISMYVQTNHCLDNPENYDGQGFELEVPDVQTPHVIGIYAEEDTEVILTVKRVSNLPDRPEYAEWQSVASHEELSKYTLATGATLAEFDITDIALEITRGSDGRYYTKDGALVVMHISSPSASSYLEYTELPSLAELAGLSGSEDAIGGTSGTNIGGYIYDGDGNFLRKESYNAMIADYIEYCDENTGVYPLTDELINMIKVHGDSSGWWNTGSAGCIFNTNIINKDYAWLFICSYVVE